MVTIQTLPALRERFPLGCEVLNLGCVRAKVVGHYDHQGLDLSLILVEVKPDGRVGRSRWIADPEKCQRL